MTSREQSPTSHSVWERFPQLKELRREQFPNHVAIIPDGNGRWAQRLQGPPILGHRHGANRIREILRDLRELPISFVTLWAFSADNWQRPKDEIDGIMNLCEAMLKDSLNELMENNVRLIHLGRKDRIPQSLKETLEETERKTQRNTHQALSLAIDFGGEDQEIRIIQKAIELVLQGKIPDPYRISPDVRRFLRDGQGIIPSADLLIRTSGEMRTSDIGWLNGRETELYFTPKLLPDLETGDIVEGIIDFSKRERRFGGRPGR